MESSPYSTKFLEASSNHILLFNQPILQDIMIEKLI